MNTARTRPILLRGEGRPDFLPAVRSAPTYYGPASATTLQSQRQPPPASACRAASIRASAQHSFVRRRGKQTRTGRQPRCFVEVSWKEWPDETREFATIGLGRWTQSIVANRQYRCRAEPDEVAGVAPGPHGDPHGSHHALPDLAGRLRASGAFFGGGV